MSENVMLSACPSLHFGRIEDVEIDVLIPPMKHDTVYMDLDHYAVKSYNAMQAALAINAIDSERVGSVGQHRLISCSFIPHLDPGLPFSPKCT